MPDTYSTAEAAELLHVSPRTIRNMIERGTLRAQKLDPNSKSAYRIPATEIERLKEEREKQTKA